MLEHPEIDAAVVVRRVPAHFDTAVELHVLIDAIRQSSDEGGRST